MAPAARSLPLVVLVLETWENESMSYIVSEVYEALREAGASEEKARAAAGSIPVGQYLASVVPMLRPQSHTGTAVQPEPSSGPLFLRHFQTFPPPDSLHPILPHRPARALQQRRDSSSNRTARTAPPEPPPLVSAHPRPTDPSAGIVAFPSIAPAAGRRAVPTGHTSPAHTPPRNVAAQGSEVSLGYVP